MEGPAQEVVIAGEPSRNDTREMIDALQSRFLPHASIMLATGTQDRDKSLRFRASAPLKAGQQPMSAPARPAWSRPLRSGKCSNLL